MRRLDILAGALLTASLIPGCKTPDLGETYADWSTKITPRVTCNRPDLPNLIVDLATNPYLADHFVVKITSTSGKTAEQDLFPDPKNPSRLNRTAVFSRYQHNQRGEKINEPLEIGDNVTITPFGISEITPNGESRLVSVARLKTPTPVEIRCVQPERLFRLSLP